jgi:hypothetical protein
VGGESQTNPSTETDLSKHKPKSVPRLQIEEQNLFVLAALKELQLATLNVLPFVYTM